MVQPLIAHGMAGPSQRFPSPTGTLRCTAVGDAGVRGTAHAVIEQLISQPMTTARAISDRHSVSAGAANHALKRLTDLGVVQEITGKPYARVYAATDVLALLHRPPP